MHEMGCTPKANASTDSPIWTPNMEAVRSTIKFAIATGRLDTEVEHAANTL
jgi:hypothetical protein